MGVMLFIAILTLNMIPFLHTVEGWAGTLKNKLGIRFHPWALFILGLVLLFMAYVFMPNIVSTALSMALFIAPVWLPFLLINGAWRIWIILKRSEFIASKKYILLEIKPPRNLVKTPLAMEAFFSSIHVTGGEATWYARFMGGTRPFFSLEIASFEGQVHFFIWSRADFRRMIESQMYAQYPGAQIVEAPDYTRFISAKPGEWEVWGCDFKHTAPDPLPIKTYIEYGLDKVQKEPEQTDPLANLIEFMASVGKGEYLWLQYVIRAHKGEKYGTTPAGNASSKLNKKNKAFTWIDEGIEMVDEIRKATRDPYVDVLTGEERPGFPNPTKGQSEKMAAIERNTSKLAFDVGARGIYIARPENFNGPTIGHLIALFKPFTTEGWNGINSTNWMKTFDDYPWEIGAEKKKRHYRKELIEAFRRRQFFYDPFFEGGLSMHETMVMSTEELATIYHVPSLAVETPSLGRVHSATGEAPANLPV
jgi:hypothetical protein